MSAPPKSMTKPKPKAMLCPQCGKPADPLFRPFCSKRCKDIDLGRWLNEDYRVPVVEEDEGADDEDEG